MLALSTQGSILHTAFLTHCEKHLFHRSCILPAGRIDFYPWAFCMEHYKLRPQRTHMCTHTLANNAKTKERGTCVKTLARSKEFSTQGSMVLGSIKELNRMILLESSTRAKLTSLGISKFKYLLIAYYVLRGIKSRIRSKLCLPEATNQLGT